MNPKHTQRNHVLQTVLRLAIAVILIAVATKLSTAMAGALTRLGIGGAGLVLGVVTIFPFVRKPLRRMVERLFQVYLDFDIVQAAPRLVFAFIFLGLFVLATNGFKQVQIATVRTNQTRKTLAPGLVYGREMYDACRIHYLEVDLRRVKPIILRPENTAFKKRGLATLAERHLHEGILASVNGTYFDAGGPIGIVFDRGRYVAPKPEWATLEFMSNRAEVELFRLATTAHARSVVKDPEICPIRKSFNNDYAVGDLGVYTPSRGVASGARRVKRLIQAKLRYINGQDGDLDAMGEVIKVVENPTANMTIKDGEFVLVASNAEGIPDDLGTYGWAKRNLRVGEYISTYLAASPRPSKVAIGGAPEFMRHGQYFASEEGNEYLLRHRHARTAVGISQDQHHLLVFVAEGEPKVYSSTFGGRREQVQQALLGGWELFKSRVLGASYASTGLTCQEMFRYVQQRKLAGQPIVSAINLDGGGSSQMVLTTTGKPVRVTPLIEISERPLANGLGFAPR